MTGHPFQKTFLLCDAPHRCAGLVVNDRRSGRQELSGEHRHNFYTTCQSLSGTDQRVRSSREPRLHHPAIALGCPTNHRQDYWRA
jgi:hypothetical protein